MNLHQVAQHVDDLERATAFYTRLLGEPPISTFDPPGLVFFRLGDTRLLLERGAPSALIYLRVDDVRTTVEQLRADGVSVANEPHVIFTDDNGLFGPPAHRSGWPSSPTARATSSVWPAKIAPPPDTRFQAARAVLVRERASSISSSVVWKLVTRRIVSSLIR
jgi:methylmalonyl-CoA/ethylmalonyl-CoA epimerase